MRGAPDGFNAPSGENPRSERDFLERAEAEAALGRQLAEEPARPLAQVGRERPADVLAARADTRLLAAPRAGAERPHLSAAKALDRERLHGLFVGAECQLDVPGTRDAL